MYVFLNPAAHLPFATVHVPFLINTLALFYNFGKSWKSDPGIIKASEEQKKKVNASSSQQDVEVSPEPPRLYPDNSLGHKTENWWLVLWPAAHGPPALSRTVPHYHTDRGRQRLRFLPGPCD